MLPNLYFHHDSSLELSDTKISSKIKNFMARHETSLISTTKKKFAHIRVSISCHDVQVVYVYARVEKISILNEMK